MEWWTVHWEMMEYQLKETLVYTHVMMVMSYLVIVSGNVRVMGCGMEMIPLVKQVCKNYIKNHCL